MAKQIRKKSFSYPIHLPTNGSGKMDRMESFLKQFSCTISCLSMATNSIWSKSCCGLWTRSQARCSGLTPVKFLWGRGGREGDNSQPLQSRVHLLRHPNSSWRRSNTGRTPEYHSCDTCFGGTMRSVMSRPRGTRSYGLGEKEANPFIGCFSQRLSITSHIHYQHQSIFTHGL